MLTLLKSLSALVASRSARRRNYRTLRALDEHILHDIGLTRSDIAALR